MLKELHQKLKEKKISAEDLLKDCFKKISAEDSKINAFLAITKELALEQAKKVDKQIISGEALGILAGIPFAVKDNISVAGTQTTAGSRILEHYLAPYDATVIKKLKSAGGIIIGKTNMDEFAMGSSTENSAFFVTKNPYDLKRVAGGSSGGSAAAVAANFVPYSLGSDTGGSIRQPASFCGIAGFKPSYGAVSRFGLIAMASSLDVIGPLAHSSEDLKIIFQVIAGKDKLDATSISPLEKEEKKIELKKLRLGMPKEYFIGGLDSEVESVIHSALEKIQEKGADICQISLPQTAYALPCYYIVMSAEVSANLARFDGIRYSSLRKKSRKIKYRDLENLYLKMRGEGFGSEVKRRILLGTYVLSAGYYDAYYLQAQKARRLIYQDFEQVFQKVDFLVTPTTPTPAFKIGEKTTDPLSMYLSDIFTVSANLAGLPAISIPCGKTKTGLPIGLQIIAPYLEDFSLLNFAIKIEPWISNF